jgi:hypothetical protein
MKIAFKLSTPEAVEYANGHRINDVNYGNPFYAEYYFHIFPVLDGGHIAEEIQPGYTDVTPNFLEDYYRPWKDKLASVQNREVNVVATLSSSSGNTDEQVNTVRTLHRNHVFLIGYTEHIYRKLGKYYSMDEIQKAVNGFASIEEINSFFDKFTLAFGRWLMGRHPRTLEHPMEELLAAFYDYMAEAPDKEQVY